MSDATAVSPTPKQAKVLGLLASGKNVDQIAKAMKISKNGVYGHLRVLRQVGLTDEDNRPITGSGASAAPAPARKRGRPRGSRNGSSTNGKAPASVQIDALVKDALGKADERTEQIKLRLSQINDQVKALQTEGAGLEAEATELATKAEALTAV